MNPSIVDPAQTNAERAEPDSATAVMSATSVTSVVDWSLVHFEVECARCGQDLRGLADPKCPACSLEFDWADAVPIERLTCATCGYHLYGLQQTRCPECGNAFTWSDALAAYRRTRQPYFEFHWRDRPVRSFLASWLSACRPKRFWKSVRLHDGAPPVGVGFLTFAGLVLATILPLLFIVLAGWLISVSEGFRTNGFRSGYYAGPWGTSFGPAFRDQFVRWTLQIYVLGAAASWGALLVLWQSMRACRVRSRHSLRVVTYAGLPFLFVPLLPLTVWFAYDIFGMFRFTSLIADGMEGFIYRGLPNVLGIVVLLCAAWAVRSIALGYRYYIQMRHAWGVAIASQVISWLVIIIVGCLFATGFR